MVEAQLRYEVFQLRRANASLQKRLSQLQGLLGELQPLWMEAPADVQEQVQLALAAHTPRMGDPSAALAPMSEEAPVSVSWDSPPGRVPVLRSSNRVGIVAHDSPQEQRGMSELEAKLAERRRAAESPGVFAPAASEEEKREEDEGAEEDVAKDSQHGEEADGGAEGPKPQAKSAVAAVPPLRPLSEVQRMHIPTPPLTERHRLDSDDGASGDDGWSDTGSAGPELGQVTVSEEHYCSVIGSLRDESAARKELEKEVMQLRRERFGAVRAEAPLELRHLEEVLSREEESRGNLQQCLNDLSEEWLWHGLPAKPSAAISVQSWGRITSSGEPRRRVS